MNISCPACGHEVEIADHYADFQNGLNLRCPECGKQIPDDAVPRRVKAVEAETKCERPAPADPLASQSQTMCEFDWQRFWSDAKVAARVVCVVTCVVVWLSTYRAAPSPWVLVNYAAIVVGTFFGLWWILGRTRSLSRKPWRLVIPLVGVALAVGAAGYFDQYENRINLESGIRIVQTCSRWGDAPVYEYWFFAEGGYGHGPVTPSGKPHGKWKLLSVDQWYWYGEQVTEGEWHERNN